MVGLVQFCIFLWGTIVVFGKFYMISIRNKAVLISFSFLWSYILYYQNNSYLCRSLCVLDRWQEQGWRCKWREIVLLSQHTLHVCFCPSHHQMGHVTLHHRLMLLLCLSDSLLRMLLQRSCRRFGDSWTCSICSAITDVVTGWKENGSLRWKSNYIKLIIQSQI